MIERFNNRLRQLTLPVLFVILVVGQSIPFSAARAADGKLPTLFRNQQLIDAWSKRSNLNIEDEKAVFRFVLGALPDRVTVYPTENYFYFYFFLNGVKYAGNIRLDVDETKEGKIVFAYFRDSTSWASDERDFGALLGKTDGVTVENVGKLAHRISFEGKSVLFQLNDLSHVKPPAGTLRKGEKYLGPVFDESGIRFFLIFDKKAKLFHYVLDETVPVTDDLRASKLLKHTLVGWRTGFAFFKDEKHKRKILIGVYSENVRVNNYLDGPFDQLPDNFVKSDELRQAFLAVNPDLKGKIDRFGNSLDRKSRELIAPYFQYLDIKELKMTEACFRDQPTKPVNICMAAKLSPQ